MPFDSSDTTSDSSDYYMTSAAVSAVSDTCTDCDEANKVCLYCGLRCCGTHSMTISINTCTFKNRAIANVMSIVNTTNTEEMFRTVHACGQCIGKAEPADTFALPDEHGYLVRMLTLSLQEAYDDSGVLASHSDISALFGQTAGHELLLYHTTLLKLGKTSP